MAQDPKSPLEALFGEGEPGALAALAVHFDSDVAAGTVPPDMLAAYLDGGLEAAERARIVMLLASAPVEFHNAVACVDHLEGLSPEIVPRDLVEAALARLSPSARIVSLHTRRAALPIETFLPLAAASETDSKALLCRSQSGIWTLEIFVARGKSDKGYLLLSVHPDHRDTYEGRTARVFTKIGGDERVLAEEPVCEGEVYADISLSGLDLHRRDAVNVTFGPAMP